MRSLLRYSLIALATLGTFGGLSVAWSFCAGLPNPLRQVAAPFSAILSEWNKQDRLGQTTDQIVRRNFMKSEIIGMLRDESISFSQAVREFEEVMLETQVHQGMLANEDTGSMAGLSTPENVLLWLERELAAHPEKKRLMNKYRRQYQSLYVNGSRA